MAHSTHRRRNTSRRGAGSRRPTYGSSRGRRARGGTRGRSTCRSSSSPALRFAVPLGVLAVLALVAYACIPWPDDRPLLFIGIDRTRSFEQVAAEDLPDQLNELLRACAEVQCHFAADGLTGHSAGDSRIPVEATLDVPGNGAEGVDGDALQRQLATSATENITTTLPFDDDIPCSDVVSGFSVALNAMSSFDGNGQRSIVLFTDGWSNCAPWNLAAATRTAEGPQQLLQQLTDQGEIPDLHSVTVHIVGGGRSSVPDSQRTARIQAFWQHYLEAAGATLPADWWRPSLGDGFSLTGAEG